MHPFRERPVEIVGFDLIEGSVGPNPVGPLGVDGEQRGENASACCQTTQFVRAQEIEITRLALTSKKVRDGLAFR